jgi:ribosomal protein L29
LQWVGLGHHLHETAGAIRQTSWQELEADWVEVDRQLARQRMQSQAFIREQLARCQA